VPVTIARKSFIRCYR